MLKNISVSQFIFVLTYLLIISFLIVPVDAHMRHSHEDAITKFTQPDGTILKLKIIGNNQYARTETVDGYTVIYNEKDKTYYYAQLDQNKDDFIKTSVKAHLKALAKFKKHLKLQPTARDRKINKEFLAVEEERQKRWTSRVNGAKKKRALKQMKKKNVDGASVENRAAIQMLSEPEIANADIRAATVTGAQRGLTILVQFPDDPETDAEDAISFPTTAEKMERFCNQEGYNEDGNSGSIRDYFYDQSNGLMEYTMLITTVVTMPQPRNYYNFRDYPTNRILRRTGRAGKTLISDALKVLKDQNFNFDGLSLDSRGMVATTNILIGGRSSGVWGKGLWSHASNIGATIGGPTPPKIEINGVMRTLFKYQMTVMGSDSTTIGTFCHELGHSLLGFPDLYDYGGDSSGIDSHGLMASGNFGNEGKTPTPINLSFKDVVGWANLTDIRPFDFINANLPATGNEGYRIINPNNNLESFIIENRSYAGGATGGDKWARYAPDHGIMIWHVDDAVRGNENQQMTPAKHYQVSLEQQDGEFGLENNRGADRRDLYDSNSPEFSDTNTPNAQWWDGSDSGIRLKVNSNSGVSMNVVFGIENRIIVISPNGGEKISNNQNMRIEWYGSIEGNVKIDLYKGNSFITNIANNEINDGVYVWNVNGSALGSDYKIRITSLNDETISDESDTIFSVLIEKFVAGGVFPVGWNKSSGSTKGWIVADNEADLEEEEASEGRYSLMSDVITHKQDAAVEVRVMTNSGVITFDAKVSSEASYDFLEFYIDGVKQDFKSDNTNRTGLSGDSGWLNFSFPVSTKGNHTFKWLYTKDVIKSRGKDRAWIDNVKIPVVPLTGIALWKSQKLNGKDPAETANGADPDGDGITNLMEYAFDLDPNVRNLNVDIRVEKVAGVLSIMYPKNRNATDLNYEVQHIGDLNNVNWTLANVAKKIMNSSGNIDYMKASLNVPENEKKRFMRLNIKIIP